MLDENKNDRLTDFWAGVKQSPFSKIEVFIIFMARNKFGSRIKRATSRFNKLPR